MDMDKSRAWYVGVRSVSSRSASAVSFMVTNFRDTANLLVDFPSRSRSSPTGSNATGVAAGRHPGQHLLHRLRTQQLGGCDRSEAGAGAGTSRDPSVPQTRGRATGTQRPPPSPAPLASVPGRGPVRIVLPRRALPCRDRVWLDQLLHYLQPSTHGHDPQPLTNVGRDLGHRQAHLIGHGERTRIEQIHLIPDHSGPLSSGRLGGRATHLLPGRCQAGGRHLKFHEIRDNLSDGCRLKMPC